MAKQWSILTNMKVLVTGSNGFIGKNLIAKLKENKSIEIFQYDTDSNDSKLEDSIRNVDFIYHLAGINRPKDFSEFFKTNKGLTEFVCDIVEKSNRKIPIVFSSSIQAEIENDYGKSKKMAEDILRDLERKTGSPVFIFRLPNVFGKWCRPNYNSVVATFCYNISHDLPIQINDPQYQLSLVYIDDVVQHFIMLLKHEELEIITTRIDPIYRIDLQTLADLLYSFKNSRNTLITEKVGTGLLRALYSTYISYIEPDNFSYEVPIHKDNRGIFVEMLKTKDSGQFSFFTAHPGVTRGGHYHHTKTEKFLVIKGKARFNFRHIITDETFTKFTSSNKPEIVETMPGWAHDITNIGDEEMLVLLWANEIFDPKIPDTYSHKV